MFSVNNTIANTIAMQNSDYIDDNEHNKITFPSDVQLSLEKLEECLYNCKSFTGKNNKLYKQILDFIITTYDLKDHFYLYKTSREAINAITQKIRPLVDLKVKLQRIKDNSVDMTYEKQYIKKVLDINIDDNISLELEEFTKNIHSNSLKISKYLCNIADELLPNDK